MSPVISRRSSVNPNSGIGFRQSYIIRSAAGGVGITTSFVARSLRFNSGDSAYLSRTNVSSPTTDTKCTFSAWVKRANLNTGQVLIGGRGSGFFDYFGFSSTFSAYDGLEFRDGNSGAWKVSTESLFRDTSAWYHFVLSVDTTQATAANRVRIYVNGVEAIYSSVSYPSQNTAIGFNKGNATTEIGTYLGNQNFLSAFLANIHFIDGQALTPSSFAETDATTGQWVTKLYSGTYGTNGFYLFLSDNSDTTATTLGKDSSGNNNNFTPTNFTITAGSDNDSLVDSPSSYGTDTGVGGEVRGNYCTLQPLNKSSNITLSNGNLYVDCGASGTGRVWGTFGVSSGKWYFEYTKTSGTYPQAVGIKADFIANDSLNGYFYAGYDGTKVDASGSSSAYGATWGNNDVIGCAFDLDAGTITFYKNGVSQGQAFSGISLTKTWYPYFPQWAGGSNSFLVNFGQRAFAYAAPSGYKALCDTNLPTPSIIKSNTVMDAAIWTGNSTNGRIITGYNFSPDFVWIKRRNASGSNVLFDTVRGFGGTGWTRQLSSDSTAQEDSGTTNTISSFNSDGFTLGVDGGVNFNGSTYVGWAWDAGSSNTVNSSGDRTSTYRANQTAGFSIVTWTQGNNTTPSTSRVAHGLNTTPKFVIVKSRTSNSASWAVKSELFSNPVRDELYLESIAGKTTSGADLYYRDSTYIGFRETSIGGNGDNMLAYCWAEIPGYSSFGTYTGNQSSDGPYVYTGFKPKWIMVKASENRPFSGTYAYWYIYDSVRDGYVNPTDVALAANTTDQEFTTYYFDFLSNGFKLRTDAVWVNGSGTTFIYACFAENPFKYARAK